MLLDMLFHFFFFLDVLYWNKRPFGLIQTQLWQSAQCSLTADLHHPYVLVPVIFSSHWSGSSSGGCVTMTAGCWSKCPPCQARQAQPPLSCTAQMQRWGTRSVSSECRDSRPLGGILRWSRRILILRLWRRSWHIFLFLLCGQKFMNRPLYLRPEDVV